MAEKIYVVTRQDLSPGQQAVQAAHALTEFLVEHPEVASQWHTTSNTLALLAVQNEEILRRLKSKARQRKLKHSAFFEPDQDNAMTAVAFEPCAKALVRELPLALSEAKGV